MEDLNKNEFLKCQPQMNFQHPLVSEMQKMYEGGNCSSGAQSRRTPLTVSTNPCIGHLSLLTDEQLIEFERKNGRAIDPDTVDIKKLKRTIANRLSAQKSRMKKSHKVEQMENKVRELEENINATKFQLERKRKTRETSRMQNIMMKQRLDYLSNKSNLTNKDIEKNKAEALWLREFLQIMKQNTLNAEKEKMKSLYVDQYEHLVPELPINQAFSIYPNSEHKNHGEIGVHGELINPILNVDAFINYK